MWVPELMRALRRSLRYRAKLELGLRSVEDAKFAALTFIQRSDSSLRLNVHFHCLALDGVYVRDAEGRLSFHVLPRPTPEEVAEVARWTYEGITRARPARSLTRRLRRHGRRARRRAAGAGVLLQRVGQRPPAARRRARRANAQARPSGARARLPRRSPRRSRRRERACRPVDRQPGSQANRASLSVHDASASYTPVEDGS